MPTEGAPRVGLGPWLPFLQRSRPNLDLESLGLVLCLDPGETTGWASFVLGDFSDCGQIDTPEPGDLYSFIEVIHLELGLDRLLYEEYRVRGNKFKEHVGSEVVTIQHIGAIKTAASVYSIPLAKQSAGMAKGFATDRKLRQWGLYQPNKRHANDAIRHGVYWHLFASGRR